MFVQLLNMNISNILYIHLRLDKYYSNVTDSSQLYIFPFLSYAVWRAMKGCMNECSCICVCKQANIQNGIDIQTI